jgi:histidinol-phosphatase (PHP family)
MRYFGNRRRRSFLSQGKCLSTLCPLQVRRRLAPFARLRIMTTDPGPFPPLIDLKVDGHIHTSLCKHASGSMEDYVRAAITKGLRTIVFLEHLEAGISYGERTWLTAADFAVYFREGKRLREKYADRITIKLGVEVGYNPLAMDTLRQRMGRYSWDLVGLSYHFLFDGGHHLNMVSRKRRNIDALAAVGPDKVIAEIFFRTHQSAGEFRQCHGPLSPGRRHAPLSGPAVQ